MRTKNAKRLWPVPATLAVVALAAFLAFGLMATTGTQPAAAQDADCTITINSDNAQTEVISIANFDTDDRPDPGTAKDLACAAVGATATIKFVGPDGSPPTNDAIELYVLVEDKSGNLSFYANTDVWQKVDENVTVASVDAVRRKGTFYTDDDGITKAKPTKYFEHNVMIPRAKRSGGRFVRQSTEITVKGEGRIHVYLPADYDTNLVRDFANADCKPEDCAAADTPPTSPPKATKFDTDQPGTNAANGDSGTINITFLGQPALGEDSDKDRNKILDDFQQCITNAADGEFDDATTDPDGNKATCGAEGNSDDRDEEDDPESRSKLVVTGSVEDGTKPLIGGKSLTYTMGDDDSVTIYAVLEDAKGNALEDMEVSFSSSTNPSGIVAARDLEDEKDTEAFTDNVSGIDIDDPNDPNDLFDAVAAYTLDGLAKVEGPYSITVEVMAGDLQLGTVTITRPDEPEKIVAGVFNSACFKAGGTAEEPDYSLATFNAKNDDCDSSGMASRFGAGEMIFVKAHLEDSLGNVVGESDDLDSELSNEDGDLLGDDDIVTIEDPVSGKEMPRAWIYTVDEDATLGDHMITVSTTARNADDEDIDDVTLTVSVAGPPDDYMISGPDNIDLGGRGMFTVTAVDANDGIPHFITAEDDDDKNDTVEVVVPDIAQSLVRGSDLVAGTLTLDEDTGMGTFTIYAPSNAADGSTARIFVSAGDVEITHTVTFGAATPVEGEMPTLMAPTNVGVLSLFAGQVAVAWQPGENAFGHLVVLFDSANNVADSMTLGPSADSHTFNGVAAGDYSVVVVSFRSGSDYKLASGVPVTVR